MADLAATVDSLARPLAEAVGVELIDVRIKSGGASQNARTRVQVVVDRKGGVDLGTCQTLSRQLGRELDEQDPLSGRYTLEVTSPGTDHPLRTRGDFDRVEGKPVKAVLRIDEEPTREVRGTVTAAGEHAAELTDADGTVHRVAYDTIVTATQELPW